MYIFSDEGQTLMITVGSLQFLGGASTSICHFVCQLVGQSIFLLCTISEEPYIIYFGHMCEIVISAFFCFYYFYIFFHFILILIFQAVRPLKGKNSPKWEIKITSVTCHTSGTVQDFWYTCVKWLYLQEFFSFSRF